MIERIEKLLYQVAEGDEHAFSKLYKLTSAKLYGVSLRMMKNEGQAQEVLQDAYTSIWRNAGVFTRDRGSPITWMTSIVRYRALDLIRRNKREMDRGMDDVVDTLADETQESDPELSSLRLGDSKELQRCLDELPDGQRECIMLSFVYGYTHEELSEKTSSPLGTVKSWVRRGLEKLKNCLSLNGSTI